MPQPWRYIQEDGVPAGYGLAADEHLAAAYRPGRADPAVLRLYTYRSHCALVGRFQHLESEIDLDFCRSAGIQVNRRPTGGGAILMGHEQLGMALILAAPSRADPYARLRDLFQRFSQGVVVGLRQLGIPAAFRRRNDLEVAGRKIAGLGLYHSRGGGLLFHCSLLVDLDLELMLRALRTPFERASREEIGSLAGRLTTVRRELGRAVTTDEVRQVVRRAIGRVHGVAVEPSSYTPFELAGIRRLERTRYLTRSWIEGRDHQPTRLGTAELRTASARLRIRVAMAGSALRELRLEGDFFAPEEAVMGLEAALRWHPSSPTAIARTVEAAYGRGTSLQGVGSAELAAAIARAVAAAPPAAVSSSLGGCFVRLEGQAGEPALGRAEELAREAAGG